MASRDITGAILRTCFGAVRKDQTLSKLLNLVLEELASAERDMDVCGDMESHAYYTGMSDAFRLIAYQIAPLKEKKLDFYYDLMQLQRPTDITALTA